MSTPSREIQLAARPHGEPKLSDFRFVDVEVPDPGPGEILVRNTYMSVDPYMRGRMNDVKSYIPPFEVGAALQGGAVGEVVASRSDTHAVAALTPLRPSIALSDLGAEAIVLGAIATALDTARDLVFSERAGDGRTG